MIAPCTVTWWRTLLNPQGSEETLESWDQLFARFSEAGSFLGKDRHPGWSPARFDSQKRAAGAVRGVYAVCLDYDGGTSLETAEGDWAGFYGFMHTSRSHTPDEPRFRVILPLSRAVSGFEYSELWKRLKEHSTGKLDEAPKDPSRFWYQPGTPHEEHYTTVVLDGAPLDVDEWLSRKIDTTAPVPEAQRYQTSSEIERRAVKYIDRMPPAISGQDGHGTTWKVALCLAQGFNLDEETTYRILRDHYNDRCDPPWRDKDLRHKAAQAKHNANQVTPGFLLKDDRDWRSSNIDLPPPPPVPDDEPDPEPPPDDETEPQETGARSAVERYGLRSMRDLMVAVLEELKRPKREGLKTGSEDLDVALGGFRPGNVTVFGAKRGFGKCLGPDVMVMKHDGSRVRAREVRVGDRLMGPDSRPRNVLALGRGRAPMYRIVPHRGTPWTCNGDHILVVADSPCHRSFPSESVEITVEDFLKKNKTFQERHKLFHVGVDYPTRPAPEVDPWFIGVWMGDGTKTLTSISVTTPDPEVVCGMEEISSRYPGLRVVERAVSGRSKTYAIASNDTQRPNELIRAMKRVIGDGSCIPESVMLGSRRTRLQFLAGIIDTDGHRAGGRYCEIATQHEVWACQLVSLCRSLGLQARRYSKSMKVSGVDRVYWRVHVSGDLRVIPARVERKRFTYDKSKDTTRVGFRIEPLGEGEYNGWELDGDGRFLLSDFTVTHNTSYGNLVTSLALERDARVALFAGEDSAAMYGKRFLARSAGVNAMMLRDNKVNRDEWPRIVEACQQSSTNPFFTRVEGRPVEWVAQAIRDIGNEQGLDLVIVDYLQCLRPKRKLQDRRNEVTYVCQQLSEAIKSVGSAGILFSQLKRGEKPEPDVEDLKESGDIEDMADHILLGWRVESAGHAERKIKVGKNKDGMDSSECHPVTMKWNPRTASFEVTESDEWQGRTYSDEDAA